MNDSKLQKIINIVKTLNESPTMSVGSGQIAGTKEAGDDPPVDLRKYRKKLSMFYRQDLIKKRKRKKD